MPEETHTAEPAMPDAVDRDDVTGYEDGDSYVLCDKRTATAWIRSDVTETVTR